MISRNSIAIGTSIGINGEDIKRENCHFFRLRALVVYLSFNLASLLCFVEILIIHEEKTKEIATVKEVWMCDPNYHKIR